MIALPTFVAMEKVVAKVIHCIKNREYPLHYGCSNWSCDNGNNQRDDFTLCVVCAHLCHHADIWSHSSDQETEKMPKDCSFDAGKLLQQEHEHNMFMFSTNENRNNKSDLSASATAKFRFYIAGSIPHTSPNTRKVIKKRLDGCLVVFPHLAHGNLFIFLYAIAFFKDKPSRTDAFRAMNGCRFRIGDHKVVVTKAKSNAVKRMLRGVTPRLSADMVKTRIAKKKRKYRDSDSSSAELDSDSDSTTASVSS